MLDTSHWKPGTFVGFVEIVRPQPIATEGRQMLWHIVVTGSGREARALEQIEELGLHPYWPRLHRKIPAGRRRSREIEVSMFPSRILVPMPSTGEALHRVRYARGVHDFMMQSDGRRLATLPEIVVDEVRRMEARKDSKYRNELAKAAETPYRKGRKVWVEIMLRKMLGTIDGLDAQGRIKVLTEVEIFGRGVWPFKPHELQLIEE